MIIEINDKVKKKKVIVIDKMMKKDVDDEYLCWIKRFDRLRQSIL